MRIDLGGAVALVSGGAGGIGGAIARMLSDAGAVVAVADLHAGGDRAYELDVTSPQGWVEVADRVERELGPIDILCNSAGIRPPIQDLELISLEDWHRALEVNATGCLLACQTILPRMKARRHGKIVNVSSTLGKESLGGSAAYGASKHALIALTQSASFEAGPFDVNVNAVCPGPVDTPLLHSSDDPQEQAALARRLGALAPLGRLASPEDIAALTVFLCSDYAKNIQGQAINVDAGRSTHT